MCRHFQEHGQCGTAERCKFAHSEHELSHWNANFAMPIPSGGGCANPAPPRPVPMGQQKAFSTFALCRHFTMHGNCRLMDQCRFAHGGALKSAHFIASPTARWPKLTI